MQATDMSRVDYRCKWVDYCLFCDFGPFLKEKRKVFRRNSLARLLKVPEQYLRKLQQSKPRQVALLNQNVNGNEKPSPQCFRP